MNRKNRGKNQNICLKKVNFLSDNKREYVIIGTTNNSYTVTVSNIVTCTCPDHETRQVRCKHIYFVLCKILKIENGDEDKYFYTNSKLRTIFDGEEGHVISTHTHVPTYTNPISVPTPTNPISVLTPTNPTPDPSSDPSSELTTNPTKSDGQISQPGYAAYLLDLIYSIPNFFRTC